MIDLTIDDKITYCILHGWQSLPDSIESDVDIVIMPQDLQRLEQTLGNTYGRLVQLLPYEATCFYFLFACLGDTTIHFLPLDAAVDYRRDGRVYFRAEDLLKGRSRRNGFWVAAPEVEFAYLLAKEISKGALLEHHKVRLKELQAELGEKAAPIVQNLFGAQWGNSLTQWLHRAEWVPLETHLGSLKRALQWQAVKRDPLNPLRYWLPACRHIWQRWWHPTGISVAVLGPDGAGKTTLINHLSSGLVLSFRGVSVFHLQPGLLRRRGTNGPVTDPHGKPPHPLGLSLLKIPYYVLDYLLGYMCTVRLKLVRSTLVLFDRYFDDLLVDPYRYRYGGPSRWVRLARHLVPRPDLFVILDVPPTEILARKREVAAQEVARQRAVYRQLAIELPHALLLDGSLPAAEVARQASEMILDYMHERYRRRRPLWFRDDGADALHWLATVLSPGGHVRLTRTPVPPEDKTAQWQPYGTFGWLPLNNGRGYLLPLASRHTAIPSLRLYNAQHFAARVAKKLLTMAMQIGLARPALRTVQVLIRREVPPARRSKVFLLEHVKEILGRQDLTFAIALGTPTLHRKPVVQIMTLAGEVLAYAKLGWNDPTNARVRHEAEILQHLTTAPLQSVTAPQLLHTGWWQGCFLCIQSAPEPLAAAAPRRLTPLYLAALTELALVHTRTQPFVHSTFWTKLVQAIAAIPNAYYRHVLQQGAAKVVASLGDIGLPFHFCHGDFAPWNAQLVNRRLWLFDWEYGMQEGPLAYDLFHFFVHTHWLLKKHSPVQVCEDLHRSAMVRDWISAHFPDRGQGTDILRALYLAYVLDKAVLYFSHSSANFLWMQYFITMVHWCLADQSVPAAPMGQPLPLPGEFPIPEGVILAQRGGKQC